MSSPEIDVLFLYRTPKKRRYFTLIGQQALTGVSHRVIAYGRLPRSRGARLWRRRSVVSQNAISGTVENLVLDDLLNFAERQHFSARDGLATTLVKRAVRPLFRLYLKSLYVRLDAYLHETRPQLIVVWNGDKMQDHVLHAVNRHKAIPIAYFENGVLPKTTTLDIHGINADNSVPRSPGAFDQFPAVQPDSPPIESRKPRRKTKSTDTVVAVLPTSDYFLVPFQLDRDSQILSHSPWINSMRELFDVCCRARDEAGLNSVPLVFREHPSARSRFADLHKLAERQDAVYFDAATSLESAVLNARAVISINSTVGLHSILSGKNVIVLGKAFYSIEGLALQANTTSELSRAMEQSAQWSMDEPLRNQFWHYLIHEYAVKGDWNHPDQDHIEHVRSRLGQFLESVSGDHGELEPKAPSEHIPEP